MIYNINRKEIFIMSKISYLNAMVDIVQTVYKKYKTVLPSVVLAQGGLESGWRETSKTLFGIKGTGQTLMTQEFINGQYVTVSANFKTYSNLTEAVIQYYELMNNSRYAAVKDLKTAEEQIKFIHKAGYATDPNYSEKIIKIISQNNLTQYDNVEFNSTTKLSNEEVAKLVIKGDYGNGSERIRRLTNEGYNYQEVQRIVNQMLK